MTAPILVTGATGNTGMPLVAQLLAAGAHVRVAARHPDAALDRLRASIPAGAAAAADALDAVRFDFTDPSTFDAFDGVERLFLLRPPEISDVRGVIVPALDAAAARGVRHVVFLSIQGAERNVLVPHHRVEAALRRSSLEWTFIRASYFMQNLSTTHAADIREHDEIFVPAGRRARTAHVDAQDVAAVAARALVDDGHEGRAYEPTGPEALTYDECATILSAATGRAIRYVDPAVWTYWHRMRQRGMPTAMVAVTLGIYTAARLGLAARTTDHVERVTGRPPRTLERFALENAAAWDRA